MTAHCFVERPFSVNVLDKKRGGSPNQSGRLRTVPNAPLFPTPYSFCKSS